MTLFFLILSLLLPITKAFSFECKSPVLPQKYEVSNLFSLEYTRVFISTIRWNDFYSELPEVAENFCKILADGSQVQILLAPDSPVHSHPDRLDDYYFPGQYLAIINKELFNVMNVMIELSDKRSENKVGSYVVNTFQRTAGFFPFHMLIGAAGYHDEDYDKTLGAFLINHFYAKHSNSDTIGETFHDKQKAHFKQILNEIFTKKKGRPLLIADGGSTGGTGGGDLLSLIIKFYLFENYTAFDGISNNCLNLVNTRLCQAWPKIEDYLNDVLDLNIESQIDLPFLKVNLNSKKPLQMRIPKISVSEYEKSEKKLVEIMKLSLKSLIDLKISRSNNE